MSYFGDIPRWHDPSKDLELQLKPSIRPGQRDWVGLFPVGWTSLKDHVTFLWVKSFSILCFLSCNLPRGDGSTLFQFVFVSGEKRVLGTTPPFRFQSGDDEILMTESLGSLVYVANGNDANVPDDSRVREREMPLLESRGVGSSGLDARDWKKAFEDERHISQRQETKYAELSATLERERAAKEDLALKVHELEEEVAQLRFRLAENEKSLPVSAGDLVLMKPPSEETSFEVSCKPSLLSFHEPIAYPPPYKPPGSGLTTSSLPDMSSNFASMALKERLTPPPLSSYFCPVCFKSLPLSMGEKSFQQHVNIHFTDSD
eukprot:m.309121 g.309121  ORF g.309121 m.309121 type:complete len:317 (+) comp45539_c0_seq1:271-1221(+)